jgi:hypothetical protein
MNIKLSYNKALLIQRAQIVYYRQSIGRQGVKKIRANTHCPEDLNPNIPICVSEINKLVPRGGDFERLLRHRPSEYDHLALYYHNAIKKGFM